VVVHHGALVMPVVVVTVVAGDPEAGEEDRRDDVQDACDDHHPCGDLVEPGRLSRNRGIGSRPVGGGRGPHSGGFWCFTHALNDAAGTNSSHYARVM
jgi:hypothetical protein